MANSKHLVIIVNNEFWKDPRVNRTARALANVFERITLLCSVTQPITQPQEQFKNLLIYRHRLFKPTYGQSRLTKWATALATKSSAADVATPKKESIWQNGVRAILFLGWFVYVLFLNFLIVARYRHVKGDLYYANDLDTLLAGYLLSKWHRAKLVYDAHELYPDLFETGPKLYRALLNKLEGYLARRAELVITVNESIAEILQQRHHLKQQPMVLLNCPAFEAVPARGQPSRRPYKLLYHGVYLPGRNLEGLILSMQYVTNAILYLRGYGISEELLRQLVRQTNLQDKVIFLEPVPMGELVSSATEFDIGIVPYPGNSNNLNSYYCTPNKIFEYMMSGLALVVSDLPELRRIVTQYQVGVMFNPATPQGLGEALAHLTAESLTEMQQRALTTAQTTFNFEQESQHLLSKIKEIWFSTRQNL